MAWPLVLSALWGEIVSWRHWQDAEKVTSGVVAALRGSTCATSLRCAASLAGGLAGRLLDHPGGSIAIRADLHVLCWCTSKWFFNKPLAARTEFENRLYWSRRVVIHDIRCMVRLSGWTWLGDHFLGLSATRSVKHGGFLPADQSEGNERHPNDECDVGLFLHGEPRAPLESGPRRAVSIHMMSRTPESFLEECRGVGFDPSVCARCRMRE